MLAEPRLRPLSFLPTRVLRFIDVDPDDGHLLWTGNVTKLGYPRVGRDGKPVMLSRWILEETAGPPPGPRYTASHKCHDWSDNCYSEFSEFCYHRLCCEPTHLKWETLRDNILSSRWTQASIKKARAVARPPRPAGPGWPPQSEAEVELTRMYEAML